MVSEPANGDNRRITRAHTATSRWGDDFTRQNMDAIFATAERTPYCPTVDFLRERPMSEKSKLLFTVLSICGTICILGALIVSAVLFQMNAAILTAGNLSSNSEHRELIFGVFAWGPSLLTLVAGIAMVSIGVRSITKEDRE
jgi:hypothetical protein